MSKLIEIIEKRRSIRTLTDEQIISDAELEKLIKSELDNLPTSYNMQNTRCILLFGDAHKALWNDIVMNTLRALVPEDKFARTQKKIEGFAGGHGTVLLYLDEDAADKFRKNMPMYANNVEPWQLEHMGMLTLSTWLLLCEAGYAATLQHYNPIIDEAVQKRWNVKPSWRLLGQMPFGKAAETPMQRPMVPIEEKVFIYR